jgi:hypothetical protein
MKGAAQGCVERYLELSGLKESSLKPVATPNIEDHLLAPDDFETKGVLATCCSKAVLKCLYMVRLARPELYWAVNALAREVTKWNIACDKRLHRLISYIHWKGETCIISYIGDKPSDCKLFLFCDASFAGDLRDSRSTSGSLLCIVGPNTFCPINWLCKKQTAVSHSSTEAEIIALDTALRMDGIPTLDLWDTVIDVLEPQIKSKIEPPTVLNYDLETKILAEIDHVPPNIERSSERGKLVLLEDNDAVIKMCIKGRAPNMRHVQRTHRINVDSIFERILTDPAISIKWVGTKVQCADIFTKGNFSEQTWRYLCRLIQIFDSGSVDSPIIREIP